MVSHNSPAYKSTNLYEEPSFTPNIDKYIYEAKDLKTFFPFDNFLQILVMPQKIWENFLFHGILPIQAKYLLYFCVAFEQSLLLK